MSNRDPYSDYLRVRSRRGAASPQFVPRFRVFKPAEFTTTGALPRLKAVLFSPRLCDTVRWVCSAASVVAMLNWTCSCFGRLPAAENVRANAQQAISETVVDRHLGAALGLRRTRAVTGATGLC